MHMNVFPAARHVRIFEHPTQLSKDLGTVHASAKVLHRNAYTAGSSDQHCECYQQLMTSCR